MTTALVRIEAQCKVIDGISTELGSARLKMGEEFLKLQQMFSRKSECAVDRAFVGFEKLCAKRFPSIHTRVGRAEVTFLPQD